MSEFPKLESLAELVSKVTQTMFGMSFELSQSQVRPWEHQPRWKTAFLPIVGNSLTIAIAADEKSASTLSCAMFSCGQSDVDTAMINDSLCELANIIAGQIKRTMRIDQKLGLPKVVDIDPEAGQKPWHSATLNSGSKAVNVWVAISNAA